MSQSLVGSLSWVFDPSVASSKHHLSDVAKAIQNAFDSTKRKSEWLGDAQAVLEFSNALEERNSLVRGLILSVVQEKWENIRLEDRSPYYSFKEWAQAVVGRNIKTLENWMRVARIVILNPEGIEFPQSVTIELKQQQINGSEKRKTIEVPFEPDRILPSKLIAAARQMKDGEMTDSKWSALCNPQVGFSEFLGVLHDGQIVREKHRTRTKMMGHIMYRDFGGGDTEEILEFNPLAFDDETNRVHRDVRAIMEFMGV